MRYYQVKMCEDNTNIYHGHSYLGFLVGGELITKTELSRDWKNAIPMSYLKEVSIPKSEVYWSFGARFHALPPL